MTTTLGYAAFDATTPLAEWSFERRDPGVRDVSIDIAFCGVCHSDLHSVKGEWGKARYPRVPGHEIVGRVTATGAEVARFHVGDVVGVGCLVDSCRSCRSCNEDLEQYCEVGATDTYAGVERQTGRQTQGGYSRHIVVDEHFVLRIPDGMDAMRTAPLLCAGITTYSPLREWKVTTGMRVGIVGLGGLGHMGIKLARALGAHVVLFTNSANKVDDALRLGADSVVVSGERAAMKQLSRSLDVILDTVSAPHDLTVLMNCLRRDGSLVLLGGSPQPHPSPAVWPFITQRRRLAGSLIGGLRETQEMLDFCAAHGIGAEIERIGMDQINDAYERMVRSDVKYRFVIDMETLG